MSKQMESKKKIDEASNAAAEKSAQTAVVKEAAKVEEKKQEEPNVPLEKKKPEDKEKLAALEAKIADLEAQIEEWKNAYAKAYADTENARKRLNKEFEQHMKYHIQDFALEILPVIDNCERALAVKPKDTEDENYRHAFEMVFKQMMKTLGKEGVEVIECEGKEFDPNWMQAVMSEEKEGVKPNHVIAVLQKGYKLKDRLLRAAMVKVSA